MFVRLILTLPWLFATYLQANGQHEISGQVLDSATRQPVSFANIYFANTSIGTVSNEKGEFNLRGFASGKYDLVVSFIGYRTTHQTITFPGAPSELTVLLTAEALQLGELVVKPDYSQRASDLRQFEKYFIGDNINASKCRIVNQDQLVAYKDDDSHALIAFARAPLEIRNEALGYKIFYELNDFEVNFTALTQRYSGVPRFEELVYKNLAQKRRWEDERRRAYNGSFAHLIHCVQRGLLDGPFAIYELHQKPNPKRPPDQYLKKKVEFWRSKYRSNLRTTNNNEMAQDSMEYYVKLYNEPLLIDSLGKRITEVTELLNETHDRTIYTGQLYIIYSGESEESAYIKLNRGRSNGNTQHSIIELKPGGISIYENGYYEPIENVFFDGYMMWSDRISNLLPREYILGSGGG